MLNMHQNLISVKTGNIKKNFPQGSMSEDHVTGPFQGLLIYFHIIFQFSTPFPPLQVTLSSSTLGFFNLKFYKFYKKDCSCKQWILQMHWNIVPNDPCTLDCTGELQRTTWGQDQCIGQDPNIPVHNIPTHSRWRLFSTLDTVLVCKNVYNIHIGCIQHILQ